MSQATYAGSPGLSDIMELVSRNASLATSSPYHSQPTSNNNAILETNSRLSFQPNENGTLVEESDPENSKRKEYHTFNDAFEASKETFGSFDENFETDAFRISKNSEANLNNVKTAAKDLISQITKTAENCDEVEYLTSLEKPVIEFEDQNGKFYRHATMDTKKGTDNLKRDETTIAPDQSVTTLPSADSELSFTGIKKYADTDFNLLQMATVCKSIPEPMSSYGYENPNIYYSPTKSHRKRCIENERNCDEMTEDEMTVEETDSEQD